ncbi:tRNA (guanine-N(7)-)-methyltransferase non-catalytic subunit trm82 [Conoideocrella luteorostrata]|uniref:tRNA (Guanine-N(7)-)-methyltransferase non-catalytic subunit trm82 n=1 Tax=Conoideocrella luteorostrata TaxID=1105319 RepID=A0AAJ0CTQ2_9HYPO|nr:tRNA (guanine-N(7)-)-methyltransferase non-catalytic subunit trm82 [Conoideocrella luteorostrata]
MSLTAIPYNRVQTTGNILFATRGGKIHSFNLSDSKHLSSWQHPDAEKFAASSQNQEADSKKETNSPEEAEAEAEESEPPAKRQKVAEAEGDLSTATENTGALTAEAAAQINDRNGKDGKRKGKKQSKGPSHEDKSRMGKAVDRPLITLMTCTDDGKHLIAVSGHDKAVWVFEHDGQGILTQLSQRVMPKRPSAVTIGFGPQIIIADKFGDVYYIPLLITPPSPSTQALRTTPAPAPKSAEPAANTLTVHSKRNLQALEHQRKQLEAKKSEGAESKSEGPNFELTLLLGHVSMLTAVLVAEDDGKKYILTADRDEHIRVSRYVPQAHIIEAFCLGHKEYISDMVIPKGKGDILISGGGDEDLFIWDWKAGNVLSKTNLLTLAREIAPQVSKVSVSGLTSLLYPSGAGESLTYVLAICEGIKAIFTWQLTNESQLKNPSIIQLPCNPLHITTTVPSSDGSRLKLIVAMDSAQNPEARSLHAYTLTRSENRLSSDVELPIHGQRTDDMEVQVSDKEIRDMFYNIENLRKQGGGEDAGSESVPQGDAESEAIPAPKE